MNDPLTPCVSKPMVTPIINAVNYEFCSFEVLKQITEDGRDGNPTVRAVEKKIADLEQTDNCILCTSGMTACSLTYLSAGDHLILFHDIYSAHYSVSLILERMGIEVTWLGAEKSNDISPYVKPKTKMIFYETPTNTL